MLQVRDLVLPDLEAVTGLYGRHVLNSVATFDEIPPSSEQMRQKYEQVCAQGLPWLVAETGGELAGYAYAALFHPRSAWRFTVEDSIYVDATHHRRGVGRALLSELIARCEALGYRQMIAAVGDSGNDGSIGLHKALGFQDAGIYKDVGLKFGRWLDVVLMQRALGDGASNIPLSKTRG